MTGLDRLELTPAGMETLLEAVPDGIAVTTVDGRILYANDSLSRLSGYSRRELIGKTVEDLVPPEHRTAHQAHRRSFVRQPSRRPMGADLAIELLTKDGQRTPVDIALNPASLGTVDVVVAAVRDDRERRRREADLRRNVQLLELAHDAIFVRDAVSDEIGYWSEGATDTYGYSRAEAIGRTKIELLDPTYANATAEAVEQELRTTGRWEGEVEHRHKDGRRMTVSSRRVLGPSRFLGGLSILEINRDVTEEKRLHGQVAVLEDRERLGREIQEVAIHGIFAAGLSLQAMASEVGDGQLVARLEAVVAQLDDVVHDIRDHIFSFRRRS